MAMSYVPNQGDVVHLEFDPSAGQEIKGPHFGLVVSKKLFNQSGLAMICPISQGNANFARSMGTVVTLMGTGMDTQGDREKQLSELVRTKKHIQSCRQG